MSNTDKDSIIVRDRSGRRQFFRRGAAFIAVGSSFAASKPVYADDCDRNEGEEKNVEAPGSDSDQGAGADPSGCGRREPPKISQRSNAFDSKSEHKSKVKTIKT